MCIRDRAKSASVEQVKARGIFPYWEDENCSLKNLGITYNAIQVPEDAPVCEDVDRDSILQVRCSFYDFSTCKPGSKAKQIKAAWDNIMQKQEETRTCYWTYKEYDEVQEEIQRQCKNDLVARLNELEDCDGTQQENVDSNDL